MRLGAGRRTRTATTLYLFAGLQRLTEKRALRLVTFSHAVHRPVGKDSPRWRGLTTSIETLVIRAVEELRQHRCALRGAWAAAYARIRPCEVHRRQS